MYTVTLKVGIEDPDSAAAAFTTLRAFAATNELHGWKLRDAQIDPKLPGHELAHEEAEPPPEDPALAPFRHPPVVFESMEPVEGEQG